MGGGQWASGGCVVGWLTQIQQMMSGGQGNGANCSTALLLYCSTIAPKEFYVDGLVPF